MKILTIALIVLSIFLIGRNILIQLEIDPKNHQVVYKSNCSKKI